MLREIIERRLAEAAELGAVERELKFDVLDELKLDERRYVQVLVTLPRVGAVSKTQIAGAEVAAALEVVNGFKGSTVYVEARDRARVVVAFDG